MSLIQRRLVAAERVANEKDRSNGPVLIANSMSRYRRFRNQRFRLVVDAALFTASLVACLASPTAFWPLPLTSWITPSPCRRSLPVASPMPCLALPRASLAVPLTLSAVAPMGTLLSRLFVGKTTPPCSKSFGFDLVCARRFRYGSTERI